MCCKNSNAPSLTRGVPALKRPPLSASASMNARSFFHDTPKGGLESIKG